MRTPYLTLLVDADISAGTDLLGKSVTDLQENIEIGDDGITGTLKYVTGYTGFSGSEELQSGNFIALHFAPDPAGTVPDSITVELIGGHSGPRPLDSDGICVFRIESTSQKIQAVADYGALGAIVVELSLEDLTLTQAP